MTSNRDDGRATNILATDLDGTLIPLPDDAQNGADLQTLDEEINRNRITLVFVTGRHFASVAQAIEDFNLPQPAWVICDVGTSIYRRRSPGEFEPVRAYDRFQERIIATLPIRELRGQLESISGLRLQEEEKQGQFKLSYYVDAELRKSLVGQIQQHLDAADAPYSIIDSVDPFNGDGLIDLLPASVSKAHALAWWIEHTGSRQDSLVFAGDSGNDLAALTAGYRSIVVGNADRELARQVESAHRDAKYNDRLYLARGNATSGVLEGCRRFGLIGAS